MVDDDHVNGLGRSVGNIPPLLDLDEATIAEHHLQVLGNSSYFN